MAARLLLLLPVVAHAALDLQNYNVEGAIGQWDATDQEQELDKEMKATSAVYAELASLASSQSKLDTQHDGAKTLLIGMKKVSEKKATILKQEAKTSKLKADLDKANKLLAKKTDEKESMLKQLKKHANCISTLQDLENELMVASVIFKQQRLKYLQDNDDGIWAARDKLAKDAFDLFKTQTECKPSGVSITTIPEPESCNPNTGGTCNIWGCKAMRHATCTGSFGGKTCVCPAGSCAKKGVCESRGDPLKATTDLLVVQNVTLAHEQAILERPEPPKAPLDLLAHLRRVDEASRPPSGSVGPAGVPGVLLVPACLAVMVVVLAAAAGRSFRAAREVRLADTCLG